MKLGKEGKEVKLMVAMGATYSVLNKVLVPVRNDYVMGKRANGQSEIAYFCKPLKYKYGKQWGIHLKYAFFFLSLHEASQKIFAFEWENIKSEHKTQFTWTVLLQGFKNSPTLFGEQLAKDLESWEAPSGEGKLLQCVDDILIATLTEEGRVAWMVSLLNFLGLQGYRVSKKKAQVVKQKVIYLGYKSWLTGEVPDDWKLAKVTPIHKNGRKDDPGNYRPVSLTSVLSKVACLVDVGKTVDVAYLDFSKAFDTVSHSRLLEKLAAHSLDRSNLCFVKNWLDGRAQRAVVNGAASSWQLVTSGDP
ncbi:hypothetical protein HGM15179_018821 [Zosterops borbonicus]|uniref:ribonuclease H n=1 Tax=Zosterops borbonicus TaxID=364589 RepID=A0A8K1DAG0_9PASS|nr:hypothetical protein HGM15179_018821 [Zosterops borbonicus]